jgi:uncharacterized membrane protein YfcA
MRRQMLMMLICVVIGIAVVPFVDSWVDAALYLGLAILWALHALRAMRMGFFPSRHDTATETERSLPGYRPPGHYRDTDPKRFWPAWVLSVVGAATGLLAGITRLARLW